MTQNLTISNTQVIKLEKLFIYFKSHIIMTQQVLTTKLLLLMLFKYCHFYQIYVI